jgi:hypothetical protein
LTLLWMLLVALPRPNVILLQLPPAVPTMLACRLALELCESLSDSTTKKQDLKDDYKAAISLARRMNAIEQPPRRTPDSSWVNARA